MQSNGRDQPIAIEASLFADVEKITSPIVESVVRLFATQLDVSPEDVRQEARIALLKALRKYDYNASAGGMLMFFRKSIRRRLLHSLVHSRRQLRHPHVRIEEGGKRVSKPVPFEQPSAWLTRRHHDASNPQDEHSGCDWMDGFASPDEDPEMLLLRKEEESTVDRMRRRLERTLDARERDVLRCKINPPRGLQLIMCEDFAEEPSLSMICKHLQLTKNMVDVAMRRIREQAREQVFAADVAE